MLVNTHKQISLSLLVLVSFIIPANAQEWSLKQCLDSALVYNRNLKISRNQVEISRKKVKEIEAGFLPKLNGNLDYKYFIELPYQLMPQSVFGGPEGKFKEAQFGVPHNINANIQLQLPLYNPQMKGAIRTGKIAADLTEIQFRKTSEQVYWEISNLYYNAQIIGNQLDFAIKNLSNNQKLLERIQLLKDQSMATGVDVDKASLQVEDLQTQKLYLESQYQQLINTLKFAIGIPYASAFEIRKRVEYKTEPAQKLQQTPDILIAKAQGRLLLSELKMLENSKLPVVSMIGTYGATGFGYDKNPDPFLKFYPNGFAGLQLSIPIFNGTITKRKISQKNLELKNSELQLSQLELQNQMQLDNARNQLMVSARSVENTNAHIQLAQKIYEKTILQHQQGTAGITEIILADNSLRDAQQKHLTAIVEYLKADLEVKRLSGNILNQ